MQKFITLFIFACIICSCEKSDNKPSQPRYLVLTRTVKMLPTEYQKGKEMKEVYTYNDFGYEDSFILYVDGENVEERKNYKHDEQGRVLHWEAFAPDGRKGLTMDYTYSCVRKDIGGGQSFSSDSRERVRGGDRPLPDTIHV